MQICGQLSSHPFTAQGPRTSLAFEFGLPSDVQSRFERQTAPGPQQAFEPGHLVLFAAIVPSHL